MNETAPFVIDRGMYEGKSIDDPAIPDEYLLAQQHNLRNVPEGHELRVALDAFTAELDRRGRGADVSPPAPPQGMFRVGAPISAAEAARRARAATARHAAGAAPEAPDAPVARPAAVSALMPCGHPTSDLGRAEGSWRGVCKGCERLERARARLSTGEDAHDILLEFEAEIRGYKP